MKRTTPRSAPKRVVDTEWVKFRIAQLGHSLRSFAPLVEVSPGKPFDPGNFSRLIRGEHELTIYAKHSLAFALAVDHMELERRFGYYPTTNRG